MIYLGVFVVNLIAVFAGRFFVARRSRIDGVGFWPWSGGKVKLDGVWRGARPLMVVVSALTTYVIAVALFTAAFMVRGEVVLTTRVRVDPSGSAFEGGMRDDDVIASIDGKPVSTFDEAGAIVRERPGKAIPILVQRDGAEVSLTVTPRSVDGVGRVGINGRLQSRELGIGASLGLGIAQPARVWAAIAGSVVSAVRGKSKPELGGAVAVSRATESAAREGAGEVLMLVGVINAYLWPLFVIISALIVPRRSRAPDGSGPDGQGKRKESRKARRAYTKA